MKSFLCIVGITAVILVMSCGGSSGGEGSGILGRAQGWKKEDTRNQWGDVDGHRFIQTVQAVGKNANVDDAKWNLSVAYYSVNGKAAVIIEGESLIPVRDGVNVTISLRDADGETQNFRGIVSAQQSTRERLFIESNRRLVIALARNTKYRVLVEGDNWHTRADIVGNLPVTITPRGSFTDSRDGQTYPTEKIGKFTWMAENLKFQTANSWCYNNDDSNCAKYGRLYTWNAAMQACPAGWRLPTRDDWNDLVEAADGSEAGTALKASAPNWNGDDAFGFSALPGGYRWTNGSFDGVGGWGGWWSATENGSGSAWLWIMRTGGADVDEHAFDKAYGFSVRCVRN